MRWWQRRPLTRRAFARQYAERSNTTVERLAGYGLTAKRCDCAEDGCHGWQMAYRDD